MTKNIKKVVIILCLCLSCALGVLGTSKQAKAESIKPWKGLLFGPGAGDSASPEAFFNDFDVMIKNLKSRGLNTVVLMMDSGSYQFKCTTDDRLCTVWGEFKFADAQRMAQIVRQNNMNLIIALEIFTHQYWQSIRQAYPEYMLAGNDWQSEKQYTADPWVFVKYNGVTYRCVKDHTSSPSNAPPATAYWKQEASDTRDPFNTAGEQLTFKMIDELIDAFTYNGVKPDGFSMEGDELDHFYDDPVKSTGKTAAEIFAMVFNNTYNHIKANNPNMEVIMWGDMLDPYWNGGTKAPNNSSGRDTAGATNYLNKNIIIGDWRYDENINTPTRFNEVKKIFPSVGEFIDKGFRVWPLSWADVKATEDLIWTGNMEQARTGKVMGHLYSNWVNHIVTELPKLLNSSTYKVPDSLLPPDQKDVYQGYYRGLADSINTTANLIGLQQCRGTDYYCGAYPNCTDCTQKSGYYGSEFRQYYCNNNVVSYNVMNFPSDYVAFWKFNGNTNDEKGQNNGTLQNGASIVTDASKGQAASFDGIDDFVKVPDSNSLDMGRGSLSISAWFKAGAGDLGTIVAKGPNLNNYTLFLHADGRLLLETNGGNFAKYTASGVNYRDNKWHHVVVIFDSSGPAINFYVDNVLSSGTTFYGDGTNDKSSAFDLFIGNNNGSEQYGFNGLLDDIMIFNRVLTPAEILRIYTDQGGSPPPIYKPEDVNSDGIVNTQDLQACANQILGIQSWQRADVNADGKFDVKDLQKIANAILGV